MLEYEYARSALKNGLKLQARLGTNPYKFGMVGSSDAHTGLAAMEEENFFGKTVKQEPSAERMFGTFMGNPQTGVKILDWEVCSAGYAAVWATENTRAAIWDAMHRRETFDPNLRAFYYARVIEIPTPRWTAYDAKRFGIKPPQAGGVSVASVNQPDEVVMESCGLAGWVYDVCTL
jgi:hypothetical protein